MFLTTEAQTDVATIQHPKANFVTDVQAATLETVRDAILQRDILYTQGIFHL